jgi:hypothetical protein
MSEVMRAECDTQPWMEICSIDLTWKTVDCDIYKPEEAGVEAEDGGLPGAIVYPILFLSWLLELHVVAIVTLPLWTLLATIATLDWILDWIWLGLFGWWCLPCAGVFIWIFNIVLSPFHILAWLQRFRLETFGLIIDGWLLIFGGSGCYLRYGKHCLFVDKRNERKLRTFWDMPYFYYDGPENIVPDVKAMFAFPELKVSSDIIQVGRANRTLLATMLPFYDEISYLSNSVTELFDF